MTEQQAHTEKETAKAELADALNNYFTAAGLAGMDEQEQSAEVESAIQEQGKEWEVTA